MRELVFIGDEGATESSGPTRRWGIDFETRLQILPWLFMDYDLTYADPRFRVTGEAIPLAPTLFMNGGLTASFPDGLSAAIRIKWLDDRPANEDRSLQARGYWLVDLFLRYRWRNIEASVEVLNLGNTDWREAQFATHSCVRQEVGVDPWRPASGGGPGVSDVDFVSGDGVNLRGGLTLFFD